MDTGDKHNFCINIFTIERNNWIKRNLFCPTRFKACSRTKPQHSVEKKLQMHIGAGCTLLRVLCFTGENHVLRLQLYYLNVQLDDIRVAMSCTFLTDVSNEIATRVIFNDSFISKIWNAWSTKNKQTNKYIAFDVLLSHSIIHFRNHIQSSILHNFFIFLSNTKFRLPGVMCPMPMFISKHTQFHFKNKSNNNLFSVARVFSVAYCYYWLCS